jgi:hypothetical protein
MVHVRESAARCVDASVPRHAAEARHGKWIELTSEQWQFLRGIYAMNPLTPPGLPYGDKAALVKIDGISGGMVFFIDGDKACTPMFASGNHRCLSGLPGGAEGMLHWGRRFVRNINRSWTCAVFRGTQAGYAEGYPRPDRSMPTRVI